jgi:hypothetical protein
MGVIVQVLHDYTGTARTRWLRVFPYTRTTLLCAGAFTIGAVLAALLFAAWVKSGFRLFSQIHATSLGITGLLLMVAAFMTFTSTLLMHAAALRCPGGDRRRG